MSALQRGSRVMIADRAAVTLPRGRSGSVGVRLGVVGALVLVVLAVWAESASATECFGTQCNAQADKQPLRGIKIETSVMPATSTYFLYWDPTGAAAFPAGYESGITAFYKGLEKENGSDQNFYSVLTQYDVGYETHFGKAITDKAPYPAETGECAAALTRPCVGELAVVNELRALVKAHKLPAEYEAGHLEPPHHAYFVLLPPGVSTCFYHEPASPGHPAGGSECSGDSFCSYHSDTYEARRHVEAPEEAETGEHGSEGSEVFSVEPYNVGATAAGCDSGQHPNGISDGALSGGMVHEFAEMITDPYTFGWFNTHTPTEEVADICSDGYWAGGNAAFAEKMRYGASLGTAPDGALYNQVVAGHDYYYQQMYSNETETCVQRKALPPVVKKLSPVTGRETGGTSVTITGLNFKAPDVTSVKFGNTPAASFTVISATSLKAVSPASSPGVVDITLTNAAGQSVAVSADTFTFTPPPTVSSVTPNTGTVAGGASVTVKGLNFLLGKTTFKFGTAKATSVNCTSTTECTMLSPAHAAGTVDVVATANKLTSPVVAGDKYTYS